MTKGDGVYPEELRYSKEHEWLRLSDSIGTIGISHYAQEELGDIVYVELPKVGAAIVAGARTASHNAARIVSDAAFTSGELLNCNGSGNVRTLSSSRKWPPPGSDSGQELGPGFGGAQKGSDIFRSAGSRLR